MRTQCPPHYDTLTLIQPLFLSRTPPSPSFFLSRLSQFYWISLEFVKWHNINRSDLFVCRYAVYVVCKHFQRPCSWHQIRFSYRNMKNLLPSKLDSLCWHMMSNTCEKNRQHKNKIIIFLTGKVGGGGMWREVYAQYTIMHFTNRNKHYFYSFPAPSAHINLSPLFPSLSISLHQCSELNCAQM